MWRADGIAVQDALCPWLTLLRLHGAKAAQPTRRKPGLRRAGRTARGVAVLHPPPCSPGASPAPAGHSEVWIEAGLGLASRPVGSLYVAVQIGQEETWPRSGMPARRT